MNMPTDTLALTDFLLARIAEDEALARDSFYEGQHWYQEEESVQSYPGADDDDGVWISDRKRDSHHIVNWQPARVLAECEAKRRIVDLHGGEPYPNPDDEPVDLACTGSGRLRYPAECPTLRLLTLPYADHPDYRDEWRP